MNSADVLKKFGYIDVDNVNNDSEKNNINPIYLPWGIQYMIKKEYNLDCSKKRYGILTVITNDNYEKTTDMTTDDITTCATIIATTTTTACATTTKVSKLDQMCIFESPNSRFTYHDTTDWTNQYTCIVDNLGITVNKCDRQYVAAIWLPNFVSIAPIVTQLSLMGPIKLPSAIWMNEVCPHWHCVIIPNNAALTAELIAHLEVVLESSTLWITRKIRNNFFPFPILAKLDQTGIRYNIQPCFRGIIAELTAMIKQMIVLANYSEGISQTLSHHVNSVPLLKLAINDIGYNNITSKEIILTLYLDVNYKGSIDKTQRDIDVLDDVIEKVHMWKQQNIGIINVEYNYSCDSYVKISPSDVTHCADCEITYLDIKLKNLNNNFSKKNFEHRINSKWGRIASPMYAVRGTKCEIVMKDEVGIPTSQVLNLQFYMRRMPLSKGLTDEEWLLFIIKDIYEKDKESNELSSIPKTRMLEKHPQLTHSQPIMRYQQAGQQVNSQQSQQSSNQHQPQQRNQSYDQRLQKRNLLFKK